MSAGNERSADLNQDQLKGDWKQLKGSVKEQWVKLTDDGVAQIEGNRDQLVGEIQEKYGVAREEAERQVNEWKAA